MCIDVAQSLSTAEGAMSCTQHSLCTCKFVDTGCIAKRQTVHVIGDWRRQPTTGFTVDVDA